MWKICQLLKGGRPQFSRSRNANNLVSSGEPSASSSVQDTERRRRFPFRTPAAFTPSEFRQNLDHYQRLLYRLTSWEESRILLSSTSPDDENCEGDHAENNGRHGRPGHDHDQWNWHCRCRCRFGELVGYTTMVAATIHLSRITVHLLPNDQENLDTRRPDGGSRRVSMISILTESVHSSWCQLFYRAAPILFPDLFKYFYVLPQTGQLLAIGQNLESSGTVGEDQKREVQLPTFNSSCTTSSSATEESNSKSTSGNFGVQTDTSDLSSPYENLVNQCGQKLAAVSRLNDVGLQHAIGVDFLKRKLYDEAVECLRQAAQSGHAGALYNLGVCFSQGYGVPRDLKKAVEFWRTAGDKGHGLSKYQMGVCHARGLGGLAVDHDRALRYMRSAADAGVPEAKTYLAANEYKNGRLETALELLCESVAAGDSQAVDLLKEMALSGAKGQQSTKSYNSFTTAKSVNVNDVVSQKVQSKQPVRRNRFWASSSSDKEDSISSPCSWERDNMDDRTTSVVFCDELKKEKMESTRMSDTGSRLKHVASSLKIRSSIQRSKTVPDFRCTVAVTPAMDDGRVDRSICIESVEKRHSLISITVVGRSL